MSTAREHARQIWQAGVDAVRPERCLPEAFEGLEFGAELPPLNSYDRIRVVGGGKAGAAMAAALEEVLIDHHIDLKKVTGLVNVPNESVIPLQAIRLHPSRPAGTNQPTEAALEGANKILQLAAESGRDDLLICLISGGGSALLPAPVKEITLADKQAVTQLLHECGATINEMNAVRKHLSRIKGGGLVRHFRGKRLLSFIISDVIDDPLEVIASGPTCVDPTTFSDALAVLEKHQLIGQTPPAIVGYLQRGAAGQVPETLKELPTIQGRQIVYNRIIANNERAIDAASNRAEELGYHVMNLGSDVSGDTTVVASVFGGLASDRAEKHPEPTCVLIGGETTVVLPPDHGLGGRNQAFVLAFLQKIRRDVLKRITILSGGTDGEDGPTDAAGAIADAKLLEDAEALGLSPADYLARHDAYHFFEPLGGLLKTGLTQTNVMDLRVILIGA